MMDERHGVSIWTPTIDGPQDAYIQKPEEVIEMITRKKTATLLNFRGTVYSSKKAAQRARRQYEQGK